MAGIFKRLICRIFLFSLVVGTPLVAESAENMSFSQKSFNAATAVGKVAAGLGLAFVAHAISEYGVVYTHEMGHNLGSRLTGGSSGNIELESNLKKHPILAFIFPFSGSSEARNGNAKVIHAGGPLAGIAAGYALAVGAQAIKDGTDKKSEKKSISKKFSAPFSVYAKVTRGIRDMVSLKTSTSSVSMRSVFLNTFILLKLSRMYGEAIYGFTPFEGDGKKLYQEFGYNGPLIGEKTLYLFSIAVIPILASFAIGAGAGIGDLIRETHVYKNLKEKVKKLRQ